MSISRSSRLALVVAILALAPAPLARGAVDTGGAVSGGSSRATSDAALLVSLDGRSPDTVDAAAVSTSRVDPLAVGYLMGRGLSSSEATSWTAGACSHATKAESCYSMLDRVSGATVATSAARAVGFRWGDAGIGAAGGLVIAVLIGAALVLVSRTNGRKLAS